MKNFLRRKLAHWLFPDPVLLANRELDNLKVEKEPYKKRMDTLAGAFRIFKEPTFQYVLSELVKRQVNFAIKEANNWECVMFHRATINGFELVLEEFEAMSGEFEALRQPEEDFNKQEIL